MDEWLKAGSAEHFFEQVNLFSQGLEGVRELVEKGDTTGALSAYRQFLIPRLKRFPRKQESDYRQRAELLLENKVALLGTGPIDIGDPIDWFISPNGDKQWQSHLGYYYFTECLLETYEETGDSRYLNKWIAIMRDFLKNHYWGVEGLEYDHSFPAYRNEHAYKYGGEGRMPGYNGGSWIGLACASRSERFLDALARLIANPAVPDTLVADILYSLVTDHFYVMLNNARRFTPNQFFHVAVAMIGLGVTLNEFKIAPAAYLVGMQRLEEAAQMCVLPDGTDLEQSFNYNTGFINIFAEVKKLFADRRNVRMEELERTVEKRCNYLALITNPLGHWPSVAKTHASDVCSLLNKWGKTYDFPLVNKVVRSLQTQEDCGIKSVSLPYGGYYAMRSGWGREDKYLFFKTSRYGMGHMHEDCNSVVLTAFGQDMLVDSGNYNYSGDPVSEKINHYFFSSFAHNTICVDGNSQSRIDSVSANRDFVSDDAEECEHFLSHFKELRETDGMRCFNSDCLDFAEGEYHDGYGATKDVIHRRQVINVFDTVYIIVDKIMATGHHSYSLNWNLSPSLTQVETGVDAIHASGLEKGRLSICTFGGGKREYHIKNGEKDPYFGWVAPGYDRMIPSNDISAQWEGTGEQLLVSVLYPHVQNDFTVENAICKARSVALSLRADGAKICFAVSFDHQAQAAGGINAECEAVLHAQKSDTEIILALDCTQCGEKEYEHQNFCEKNKKVVLF